MTDQIDVAIAKVYKGPFADERLGLGPFINCMPASGLNVVNAAVGGGIPTDDDEVTALRRATGDTSGAEDFVALKKGLVAKYHFPPSSIVLNEEWKAIQTGLVSGGMAYVIVGDYWTLPAHLQRWQPGGRFAHAVSVFPLTKTTVLWVDPLAKDGPKGEEVSIDVVRKFAATGHNQSLGMKTFSMVPSLPKWVVAIQGPATSPFWLYTQSRGKWSRVRGKTGGLSSPSTPRRHEADVLGADRWMVQLTRGQSNGAWKGSWVELTEPTGTTGRITVKEA